MVSVSQLKNHSLLNKALNNENALPCCILSPVYDGNTTYKNTEKEQESSRVSNCESIDSDTMVTPYESSGLHDYYRTVIRVQNCIGKFLKKLCIPLRHEILDVVAEIII